MYSAFVLFIWPLSNICCLETSRPHPRNTAHNVIQHADISFQTFQAFQHIVKKINWPSQLSSLISAHQCLYLSSGYVFIRKLISFCRFLFDIILSFFWWKTVVITLWNAVQRAWAKNSLRVRKQVISLNPRHKCRAGVWCHGRPIPRELLPLRFPWQSHQNSQECHIIACRASDLLIQTAQGLFLEMKVIKISHYSTESRLHFLNHPDNCSGVGVSLRVNVNTDK